jgi:hypothetical protein
VHLTWMEGSERQNSAHIFIEISGAPDHNYPTHRQEPDCKNESCCSIDHLILPWPCSCKPTGVYHSLPCGLRRARTHRSFPARWQPVPLSFLQSVRISGRRLERRYREAPANLYALVIEPREFLVEAHAKSRNWEPLTFRQREDTIEMPEFGLRCSVVDLYRGTPLAPGRAG